MQKEMGFKFLRDIRVNYNCFLNKKEFKYNILKANYSFKIKIILIKSTIKISSGFSKIKLSIKTFSSCPYSFFR
jgi:hypothetical protein